MHLGPECASQPSPFGRKGAVLPQVPDLLAGEPAAHSQSLDLQKCLGGFLDLVFSQVTTATRAFCFALSDPIRAPSPRVGA